MNKLLFLSRIKPWVLFSFFISIFIFSYSEFYRSYILGFVCLIWLCWVIMIGFYGRKYIQNIEINGYTRKRFTFCSYMVLLISFLQIISNMNPKAFDLNQMDYGIQIFLIIISAFSAVFTFYILIITSIIITSIQRNQKSNFIDSLGNFFRLLFFPFGVLFIQPLIYKKL